MTVEERVLRLENAFATLSELVAQEAARADTLLRIVRDHDERMETQTGWINQLGAGQAELQRAQTEAEAKIAALADAQIRTEEAQAETNRQLRELAEIVRAGRNDGGA